MKKGNKIIFTFLGSSLLAIVFFVILTFLQLSKGCEDFDFERVKNLKINLHRCLNFSDGKDTLTFFIQSCDIINGTYGVCDPRYLLVWHDKSRGNYIFVSFRNAPNNPEKVVCSVSFNHIDQVIEFNPTETLLPNSLKFEYERDEYALVEPRNFDFEIRDFAIRSYTDSLGNVWNLLNCDSLVSLSATNCDCLNSKLN